MLLIDIVLLLEVLYDMLVVLLDESTSAGTSTLGELSESNLFKLSMQRRENLLKQGYLSRCLAAALANILKKKSPWISISNLFSLAIYRTIAATSSLVAVKALLDNVLVLPDASLVVPV